MIEFLTKMKQVPATEELIPFRLQVAPEMRENRV